MNNRFAKTALAAAIVLATGSAGAAIIPTPNTNAAALAALIAGSGISVIGGTEVLTTNTTDGVGTFTGGASSGLGIDTGVVLTTGVLSCVPGPNDESSCSGGGSFARLQFDFTTTSGDLFFQYVFGSEEYNEFVGTVYNDAFTLLVDGVNVALVPGGGGAVTINNVNNGSNAAYYRDNSAGGSGGGGGPFDLQYDGMTVVLTAAALGLGAGTHTMDFFITDQGDSIYDSGVFIREGSFTDVNPNPTPEPATLALFGVALAGLGFSRRRKVKV